MGLLKGTGNEEIKIDVTAKIKTGAGKSDIKVKFVALYKDISADLDQIRAVGRRLSDEDDDYGDEALVDDFFIGFEKLIGQENQAVECNDESRAEVLAHRDYFHAILGGCTEALFGDRGRIKN